MKNFLDFDGISLELGDTVTYLVPGYRAVLIGTVIAFTDQKVRVYFQNTWGFGDYKPMEILLPPEHFMKYTPA